MRLRFGIRIKLIGMINTILLIAAAAIVMLATTLFSKDNVARVQENNLDAARLLASEIQNDLTNLTEKMRLLGISLMQNLTPDQAEALQRPFFERENDLLAELILVKAEGKANLSARAIHEKLIKSLDVPAEDIIKLHENMPVDKLFSGSELIQSGQLKGNLPVLTIGIPLLSDDKGIVTHVAVATLKQDRFLKAVQSQGIITSYLVDSQGYLLAHPEQERVLKRENLAHLEIVKQLLSGKTNNGQTRFVDPQSGAPYLAAFMTVGFGGIGVLAQVEEAKAFEAAQKVRNTSIYTTGIISILAFLLVFFFSLSLTQPLVRLVDATQKVSKGDYEVTVKKGANDEIGDLTASFNEMVTGLKEREKIKNAFSKFHSKEVADKILSGELCLTGERRKVTIFFSDIRSFTSISEKLQPEQVVELINGYMTRMVRIIFAHGGVVDKYVGDAIMAVYGAPLDHGDDALRAVAAAIRMRAELKRFNESQLEKGKPTIAIGMGMNTGDVVVGNIGSPERMEYTILGDEVNLASRMESQTKEFKTDILISASTYEDVKDWIECVPRGTTKVKGKANEVLVYEVVGFLEGREYIPPETGVTGETVEPPETAVQAPAAIPTPPVAVAPPAGPELTPEPVMIPAFPLTPTAAETPEPAVPPAAQEIADLTLHTPENDPETTPEIPRNAELMPSPVAAETAEPAVRSTTAEVAEPVIEHVAAEITEAAEPEPQPVAVEPAEITAPPPPPLPAAPVLDESMPPPLPRIRAASAPIPRAVDFPVPPPLPTPSTGALPPSGPGEAEIPFPPPLPKFAPDSPPPLPDALPRICPPPLPPKATQVFPPPLPHNESRSYPPPLPPRPASMTPPTVSPKPAVASENSPVPPPLPTAIQSAPPPPPAESVVLEPLEVQVVLEPVNDSGSSDKDKKNPDGSKKSAA